MKNYFSIQYMLIYSLLLINEVRSFTQHGGDQRYRCSVDEWKQESMFDTTTTLAAIRITTKESDELWEEVRLEATSALAANPETGALLYQGILSQPGLLEAIVTVISHEIATELIPATALKNLFFEMLTSEDDESIRLDLTGAATRSACIESTMAAALFHKGFHTLVCYRVGHRLWLAGRNGLAYYMQSTVSQRYSADIHPAARMGSGIHLRAGAGVVIGETAVVGNDSTIMGGVTLGGTGKEAGDRHPKVGNGVTILDGAAVLGNIAVGDGSIILSKSIVTKPVPHLAIMSGVPARVQGYRQLTEKEFEEDRQRHLIKYIPKWKRYIDSSS